MKKIFTLFFVCVMLITSCPISNTAFAATGIWDGTVANSFASGTGTSNNPYVIRTASQLAYFAKSVNEGNHYENKYVVLENDICLNAITNLKEWDANPPRNAWTPIGRSYNNSAKYAFWGNFNGKGHTVSGLYINSNYKETGLFGYVFKGKVENIAVKSSYIKGGTYTGGISGYAAGSIIQNCYSNATVKGTQYAGGILGSCMPTEGNNWNMSPYSMTISNCCNEGTVSSTTAGGISGEIDVYKGSYSTGGVYISNLLNLGLVNNGNGNSIAYVHGSGYKSISNCYYLETSGIGEIGTSKTSAELKKQSTYSGFNFSTVWGIDEGKGYPYLRVIYEASKPIEISSVSMMSPSATIKVGDTYQAMAYCMPTTATDKTLTWSTNNPLVATVNNNGVVTAKGPGKATITAKSNNGKKASCIVTVTKQNVIDYDDFKYSFSNSHSSFGYSDSYKIPEERYMQLGDSKSVAKEKVKNSSKWGGNCFGMSNSSILFYKNILQEERYNTNVNKPKQFNAPNAGEQAFLLDKWEIKLRHMIELFQLSYGLPECTYKEFSASDIAKELDKGNPVSLFINGIKASNGSGGGHEVVIYGYTLLNNVYTFKIYDCSDFVYELVYHNERNFEWGYNSHEYDWNTLVGYYTFDTLYNVYDILKSKGDNEITLFSLRQEPTYTYIFRTAENLTITNSLGQTSTISNGELLGDIDDAKLIPSSYLSEEPTYTIILPTDTYTIIGSGDELITTSFADDYMSASVTAKSNTPITISSDLKEISVDTVIDEEYDITYTTYDNIFDEMNLSGTATGTVTSTFNDADITITGVNTLTALASVSDSVVSANSDSLSNSDEITVKCEEADSIATIQILSADAELTDKTSLPERLTVDTPAYDLVSGTYTEGQVLNFTKDDETIIYYTTDGSIPSADNGIIYSLPIDINKSMTVKAISTKYGYLDSEIVELNYTLPEVNAPQANLESGEYDTVITVELSTDNYEDTIYYTLDGSSPLENGILYTVPINISEDTYLQAYTLRNGCISEISEYEYTVTSTYPFYFSNSLTNQDGDIITPDNIADVTKVKMTLSKLHTDDYTGMFLIAFYGADNRLIYVNYKTATISEDIDEVEIDITEDVSSAYKIKAFAWKDLSSIQPICEALEENIIIE